MHCERCGSTELADHPYDRTFTANTHQYDLCAPCQAVLTEIIIHAAQGGLTKLFDARGRVWSYWVEDGRRMTYEPEGTASGG